MRTPMLFAGAAAMLLSFTAAKSTAVYLTLSVGTVSTYLILYFAKNKRLHFLFAALLLFILICVTALNFGLLSAVKPYDGKTEKVTAVIKTEPVNHGIAHSYTAKLEGIGDKKIYGTSININMPDNSLCPGDRITAVVNLYEHDNKESFYAENIFIHGEAKELIRVVPNHNSVRYRIYTLQVYIRELIKEFIDGDTGQLICAVISGDSSGISDETYALIKRSGVTHMIVVSGMHLSVIFAAVMWIFRRTLPNRFVQGITMLVIVFLIMLFCGFTKSVLRAGITYIILTLAAFFRRDGDSLSALSLTVTAVMLINPFAAYSVSFQLTISATFGILVLAPIIGDKINRVLHTGKIPFIGNLVNITAVTLSSNIMTLPIVLYVYEWVSVVSLATNILINYSVCSMMVIGIVAVLVGKVQFLAYPCFALAGMLSKYSLSVIEYFGSLPFATVDFSGKALSAVLCMLFLVVYLYYILIRKKKLC